MANKKKNNQHEYVNSVDGLRRTEASSRAKEKYLVEQTRIGQFWCRLKRAIDSTQQTPGKVTSDAKLPQQTSPKVGGTRTAKLQLLDLKDSSRVKDVVSTTSHRVKVEKKAMSNHPPQDSKVVNRTSEPSRIHVVKKTHQKLMFKSRQYAWWHSWKIGRFHHTHVHAGVALTWAMLVVLMVGSLSQTALALSDWQQTDWSGGQGTNTTNQYASATGIDTSVAGQLTLTKTGNSFANSSLDSSLSSWNGSNLSQEATNTHTGAGSAKITAGLVSSYTFYGQLTNSSGAPSPKDIAMSDVNNDGIDDTVITNTSGSNPTIELKINDGVGGGTQSTLSVLPGNNRTYNADIADMNNDGWKDILVSYYSSSCLSVSVFLNNGTGSFLGRNDYTSGGCGGGNRTCDFAIADFNIDGFKDFVQNCNTYSYVRVWINNGSGAFPSSITYNKLSGTYGNPEVVSTDINGDSKPDIVYGYGINETPSCTQNYMLNSGSGFDPVQSYTLQNCSSFNVGAGPITSADLNADGFGDVLMCRRGYAPGLGQHITVLFGSASGSFANQADYPISSQADYCGSAEVAVADISGDGLLDVAVSSTTSNTLITRINTGSGVLGGEVAYATGTSPTGLATGDVNGDGKIDVSVANAASNTISVLINRTGGDAMTQAVNLGDTDKYQVEAYVKTNGTAVTSADAEIYANGSNIATSYSDVGNGWYKLSGIAIATTTKVGYGVVAKQGKVIYVDDLTLYKYASSGALSSSILDLGFGGDWGTLAYVTNNPAHTAVKVRTSNNSDMSGAPNFSTCSAIASGSDLTGQSCVGNNDRYVQYEVALTNDNGATPVFESISIQYDAWDTILPTSNASSLAMKKVNGGQSVAENAWTNGATPYFSWDAGTDADSGIKGYCLYLGTDNTADPVTTKGLLGASPNNTEGHCQFLVTSTFVDTGNAGYMGAALTTSNSPYYLRIKAIDFAGNLFPTAAQFAFRFDDTPPKNPAFINAPSQFVADKNVTLTWPTSGSEAASDDNSGLAGLQYKIGNTTWYGDTHNGAQDLTDLLANDGSYATTDPPDFANINEGNNTVYFRTWDQAGNSSTTNVTTAIKLNTNAPGSPQNVTASPSTSSTNSFAFSWVAPSSFQGAVGNITYCYTINTLPTINTCTYTEAGVTSLPAGAFATQPGDNTFYVVAKDEAGNINYATASSVTFTANTTAPGIPLNLDIADVSIKSSSTWRLALSWNEPSGVGAGVASYKIYRSTDNNNYSQVASTAGASYVDSGLASQQYFYRVKACDSANNCGVNSAVVSDTPTGKFTEPANLADAPSVTMSTRSASIRWVTDRTSDSRIQYGLSSGNYFATEAASSEQTKVHSIQLSNLDAGTTYYYRARWTDEDGNVGTSGELSFTTLPAPVVKDVSVTRVTTSTASIRFTVREASQIKFTYGKSDSFGGLQTINTSQAESTYTVELNELDDGTNYYFGLNPIDSDGNEYKSSQVNSFATPALPRITNLRFDTIEGEPSSTQKIVWTTNVPTTSEVVYGLRDGKQTEAVDSVLVVEHEMVVRGLEDNTSYQLVARSRDAAGNLAISDRQFFQTAEDTRAPKISDLKIETDIRGSGGEARGQVIVSWRTDEPATSQVAFAKGRTDELSNRSSQDTRLTTEHVVVVSDLTTSSIYQVQAVSADKAGNESSSDAQTAIIGRGTDSIFSVIFNALQAIFGFEDSSI